jgi:hypothetical protein
MSQGQIDFEIVRRWVYQALKNPTNPQNRQDLQHLLLAVYLQACAEKHCQPRMQGPNFPASPNIVDMPPDLQNSVRAVVWELIIQGIIVPGIPNQLGQSGLPAFTITEWGQRCLNREEYVPYDAAKYLEQIQSEIPKLDHSVPLYLKDALSSFRVGAYLSSAVMCGVASERVLLVLRLGIEGAIQTADTKKRFADATKGVVISRVFKEIWKRLEPNQESLAKSLGQEDVKLELSNIFDLIRKTRNDAGHPTDRTISRDEADSILRLFPVYCKAVYATLDWLAKNPLP